MPTTVENITREHGDAFLVDLARLVATGGGGPRWVYRILAS
jgi:hypothetical protein